MAFVPLDVDPNQADPIGVDHSVLRQSVESDDLDLDDGRAPRLGISILAGPPGRPTRFPILDLVGIVHHPAIAAAALVRDQARASDPIRCADGEAGDPVLEFVQGDVRAQQSVILFVRFATNRGTEPVRDEGRIVDVPMLAPTSTKSRSAIAFFPVKASIATTARLKTANSGRAPLTNSDRPMC